MIWLKILLLVKIILLTPTWEVKGSYKFKWERKIHRVWKLADHRVHNCNQGFRFSIWLKKVVCKWEHHILFIILTARKRADQKLVIVWQLQDTRSQGLGSHLLSQQMSQEQHLKDRKEDNEDIFHTTEDHQVMSWNQLRLPWRKLLRKLIRTCLSYKTQLKMSSTLKWMKVWSFWKRKRG